MSTDAFGISFGQLTGNYGFIDYEPYDVVIPTPWGADPPKPPKDYLWCTKGWENDCLHVKVLNAQLKFFSDDVNVKSEDDWEYPGPWTEHRKFTSAIGDYFTIRWSSLDYKTEPFGGVTTDWVCERVCRVQSVDVEARKVVVHWTWRRWEVVYGRGHFSYPLKPTEQEIIDYVPNPRMDSGTSTYDLIPIHGHWAYPQVSVGEACLFNETDRLIATEAVYSMSRHGIYVKDSVEQPDEVQTACAKAYYKALQDCVDKLNDNNVQNIGELAALAAAFLVLPAMGSGRSLTNRLADGVCDFLTPSVKSATKRVIYYNGAHYYVSNYEQEAVRSAVRKTIKGLAALWLPWRYAYCTSQTDVNEAAEYLQHRIDESLEQFPGGIHKAYGSSNCTAKNGTQCHLRCRLDWRPANQPEGLENWNKLWRYGLEINPYVIWDLIPFSFIVDWFAPVGNVASIISDYPHLAAMVDVDGICFSNKYVYDPEPGLTLQVYNRWHSYVEPDILKSVETGNPKLKTQLKRLGDVVALTIGGTL